MKRRKFFLKRSVKWHFSFIRIGDKHEMKNQIGFSSKTITDPTVTQVKTYIKAAGLWSMPILYQQDIDGYLYQKLTLKVNFGPIG